MNMTEHASNDDSIAITHQEQIESCTTAEESEATPPTPLRFHQDNSNGPLCDFPSWFAIGPFLSKQLGMLSNVETHTPIPWLNDDSGPWIRKVAGVNAWRQSEGGEDEYRLYFLRAAVKKEDFGRLYAQYGEMIKKIRPNTDDSQVIIIEWRDRWIGFEIEECHTDAFWYAWQRDRFITDTE